MLLIECTCHLHLLRSIFKEIEIIDDKNGLFEVTYRINGDNMQKETKGLYSADEGFLIPFGTEYEFPEYYSALIYYFFPFFFLF